RASLFTRYRSPHPCAPHSFPTRRSSDLTESSDVVFLVRLVASGLASALVPRLALHAAAMSTGTDPTGIAIGRLPEPANRRISTAIRRGSARTPRIIALRDALRAEFFRP